jgi:preprotein translocase subunit SecG
MAQNGAPPDIIGGSNINVVILVLATIFAGIILFLIYLERKLNRLEKRVRNHS